MTDPSSDMEHISFHVSDPPHENYFYADRNLSCQVILSNPLSDPHGDSSAGHRLLFAWPGGNSGAALFFESLYSQGDPPRMKLEESHDGRYLNYFGDEYPSQGVCGHVSFSHAAVLSEAIFGSVRTIRDYTEGHGILNPKAQEGVDIDWSNGWNGGLMISRTWFDRSTVTRVTFFANAGPVDITQGVPKARVIFSPGVYRFQAELNYPQPPCVLPARLLKPPFHKLISQQPDAIKCLSFLHTSTKVLAGAWRFLTYFGRDSMISLLLLNPILSDGDIGPIEIGLSAVLERINYEEGTVCHEENIGDYPAAQAALAGYDYSNAEYDYKMVALISFTHHR